MPSNSGPYALFYRDRDRDQVREPPQQPNSDNEHVGYCTSQMSKLKESKKLDSY